METNIADLFQFKRNHFSKLIFVSALKSLYLLLNYLGYFAFTVAVDQKL